MAQLTVYYNTKQVYKALCSVLKNYSEARIEKEIKDTMQRIGSLEKEIFTSVPWDNWSVASKERTLVSEAV